MEDARTLEHVDRLARLVAEAASRLARGERLERWRPGSMTHFESWEARWCMFCARQASCTMPDTLFNGGQPRRWWVLPDGTPVCLSFTRRVRRARRDRPPRGQLGIGELVRALAESWRVCEER